MAFPYGQACLVYQIFLLGKVFLFHVPHTLRKALGIIVGCFFQKLHYISKIEGYWINCFFDECWLDFLSHIGYGIRQDSIMFRSYIPLLNPKLAVCIKHPHCCFKSINWFFWYLNNGVGLSSSSEFSTYLYSNSKTSNLLVQFLEMCSSETFFWLEPGQCFLFLENFFFLKLAFFHQNFQLKKSDY